MTTMADSAFRFQDVLASDEVMGERRFDHFMAHVMRAACSVA